MKFSATDLAADFKETYGLDVIVRPLDSGVVFLGTELEVLKLAYQFKNKESVVGKSTHYDFHYVSFPNWFGVEFAQNII